MSNDKTDVSNVISSLKHLGWRAVKIPEDKGGRKTPDLNAPGKTGKYLVEIKARRTPARHLVGHGNPDLEQVRFFQRADPWVIKRTKDALAQFKHYDEAQTKGWLVWFETDKPNQLSGSLKHIEDTVLGTKYILVSGANTWPDQPSLLPCHKAQEPLFELFPEILGVFACLRKSGVDNGTHFLTTTTCLFVNEEHPRYEEFSQTPVYKKMDRKKALARPSTLYEREGVVVADRYYKDEQELSDFVLQVTDYQLARPNPEMIVSASLVEGP